MATRTRWSALALVTSASLLAGAATWFVACTPPSSFPSVVKDDAGDRAWVRQVVPIVLGRKAKGYEEVRLLADLVHLTDRETVLRGLMQEPEFNEHWADTLVNLMRIDREATHLGFESDQSDCYGAPLRAGAPTASLSQHILANASTSVAPGGAFNMSDVVRSALEADNLAGLYRANLFALQHHQASPGILAEQQARDETGRTFGEVYLNRQSTCLVCHNSDFSTTGPSSNWTRWFPIMGSFETALYGASTGGQPADIHAMFRRDQDGSGAGFGAPWGITGCGQFQATMPANALGNPYFGGPLATGATMTTVAALFKQGYDGLSAHGLARSVPAGVQTACNTCKNSCAGSSPLDPEGVVNGAFVRDLLSEHAGTHDCGTCHGATQDLWFFNPSPSPGEHWYSHLINIPSNESAEMRVAPGDSAHSALIRKLSGTLGSTMPLGGSMLSSADIAKVAAWIDALPPDAAACTNCPTLDCDPVHLDHPAEGFAYMTAARIVNAVWQETMGYPLTIANYFPRNAGQRGALWNLTEYTFIPSGWSLRSLLVRILTADTFNRHTPAEQVATGNAYQLPALYEPWQLPDPRVPPANQPSWHPSDHPDLYSNAMSDGIYRYSAWNLLRSAGKALDWPMVQRFPSPVAYPSEQLERDIGQYFSTESPGFRVTNFPALLSWEKAHGTCANLRPGMTPDWIARLATAAASFTPAGGDPPLTLGEVLAVERDWLLSDATFGTSPPPPLVVSEEQSIAAIVGPLTTQVSSLSGADLSAKLRNVCGILLETPHFLLAGVAPEGPGGTPRLRVCNGAPCSYQEMCNDVTSHIPVSGALWQCGASSVSLLELPEIGQYTQIDHTFCPECPVISIDPGGCFTQPGVEIVRECNAQPPACDPRCSRIDCCGGPLPRFDRKGAMVLYGDGATVTQAQGAQVRRAGRERAEPLKAGDRLKYGDVLMLPAEAQLVLNNAGREMKYAGRQGKVPPRYVIVSGPQALTARERQKVRPPLTRGQLEWLSTKGGRVLPDGASPAAITPQMRAPGKAEEQWQAHLKQLQLKR